MGQNTPSRQNHPNAGHFYSNIAKPVRLDLSFIVTPTNGLGITSLKSNGYVNNVFMHTSTTPAANNGFTNPNPADGVAMIQLRNNFNAFLGASWSVTSTGQTATKIDNSAMTAGNIYVISTLGDASLAKWQSIGVPVGVTPAVGVAFVALTNGGAGNVLTSRVMVPNQSGIDSVEFFGNPILTANSNVYANSGLYLIAQFMANSFTAGAYTPAGTVSAPIFTGESYTPTGTVAAGVIPVTAGTAGDAVTNNAGVLESTGGQDLTVNSQAFTGDAHTLAGTNSAPTFTGSAGSLTGTSVLALTAPTAASLINMSLFFDASSVTVDGL